MVVCVYYGIHYYYIRVRIQQYYHYYGAVKRQDDNEWDLRRPILLYSAAGQAACFFPSKSLTNSRDLQFQESSWSLEMVFRLSAVACGPTQGLRNGGVRGVTGGQ